jgi:hypothetical protein
MVNALAAEQDNSLCEGLPVGAMSTGAGGIGNESVETLLKDPGGEQSRGDSRASPAKMEQPAGAHVTISQRFRTVSNPADPRALRST